MATTDAEALFVDTNILVYANVLETPLHEPALAAIQTAHRARRSLRISRQVIREYLVTMTRPQTFENLPKATVIEQVNQFIERFPVRTPPPSPAGSSSCPGNSGLAASRSTMPTSSPPCWLMAFLAC